MTIFWKSWILAFWHPRIRGVGGREGVCGQIFAIMLLHSTIPFNLVYATWQCSEKVELWPIGYIPRVGGGGGVWGLRAKYLLPCCCFRDSLNCDLQGNHVLKKSSFDPRVEGVGVGGEVVYGQNMCYHVAAFVILFNLICNILGLKMYAKEYNFGPIAHFTTINNLPKEAKEWQQAAIKFFSTKRNTPPPPHTHTHTQKKPYTKKRTNCNSHPYIKQVTQWATIAHFGDSIMFEKTIIHDSQWRLTMNLKQWSRINSNTQYIMPVLVICKY